MERTIDTVRRNRGHPKRATGGHRVARVQQQVEHRLPERGRAYLELEASRALEVERQRDRLRQTDTHEAPDVLDGRAHARRRTSASRGLPSESMFTAVVANWIDSSASMVACIAAASATRSRAVIAVRRPITNPRAGRYTRRHSPRARQDLKGTTRPAGSPRAASSRMRPIRLSPSSRAGARGRRRW